MLHESQLLHCLHDIQEVTSCIQAPFLLLENVLMLALAYVAWHCFTKCVRNSPCNCVLLSVVKGHCHWWRQS